MTKSMTPQEALAQALKATGMASEMGAAEDSRDILLLLNLAGFIVARTQDAKDGEALRLLRDVVPGGWAGWEVGVRYGGIYRWPLVEVWDHNYPPGRDDPPQPRYISSAATIAEAADACREALR